MLALLTEMCCIAQLVRGSRRQVHLEYQGPFQSIGAHRPWLGVTRPFDRVIGPAEGRRHSRRSLCPALDQAKRPPARIFSRSAAMVVSSPWPVFTTVSSGRVSNRSAILWTI